MVRGYQYPRWMPNTLRNAGDECTTAGNWFEAKPEPVQPMRTQEQLNACHRDLIDVIQLANRPPWPFPEPERPRWKLWLARCLGL